jgi:hypothetical protein
VNQVQFFPSTSAYTVNGIQGKVHFLALSLLWINMSKNQNFPTTFGERLKVKFKKSDSLTVLLDHKWTDETPTQGCFLKFLKEQ